VVKRSEGDGNGDAAYLAEVLTGVSCESPVAGILWNVTRDALYFQDMPYGRDHHQPWAFRHEMHIPDDIFPEIWKTTTTFNETLIEKAKCCSPSPLMCAFTSLLTTNV
jgi:hypothetical protein